MGAARVVAVGLLVLAVLGGTLVLVERGTGSVLGAGPECRVGSVALSTAQAQAAADQVASGRPLTGLSTADSLDVTAALSGRVPRGLSCDHGPGLLDEGDPALGPQGLTARAAAVRRALDAAFGRQRVGGFAPDGVSTGHMEGSAHYEGRAVDVFYRPVTATSRRAGWATAQWLVAHADRLAIATVIYDGAIWTARRSDEGWRDYRVDTTGRDARTAAILEHRDHVHVDVA